MKEKLGDDFEYRFDEDLAMRCLSLKADNGYAMRLSAFWCGHFEQLGSIEIYEDAEENGMRFEF